MNQHTTTCPAPDHDHTHASVARVCDGRFGTCGTRVSVDVWRYTIGRDRERQMGTGQCPACHRKLYVQGDVPAREQAVAELSALAVA